MERIFGIDLGTTHSLIAVIEEGAPRVLAAPGADALLPSVVALKDDRQNLVGTAAIELESSSAGNVVVVRSVKRYMGLGQADLAPDDRDRYTFADSRSP